MKTKEREVKTIKSITKQVKKLGYQVFVPSEGDRTYFYYSDGKNVAAIYTDRAHDDHIIIGAVHKYYDAYRSIPIVTPNVSITPDALNEYYLNQGLVGTPSDSMKNSVTQWTVKEWKENWKKLEGIKRGTFLHQLKVIWRCI